MDLADQDHRLIVYRIDIDEDQIELTRPDLGLKFNLIGYTSQFAPILQGGHDACPGRFERIIYENFIHIEKPSREILGDSVNTSIKRIFCTNPQKNSHLLTRSSQELEQLMDSVFQHPFVGRECLHPGKGEASLHEENTVRSVKGQLQEGK